MTPLNMFCKQILCFICLGAEATNGSEEEGTRHFMVNVIEPQFNLHSEDVNVSI